MTEARRLTIDMGDLLLALEGFGGEDATYYLDLETGDVFFLSGFDVIEEMEELAELVETHPERFEAVPSLETHEAYQDMEAFIETVTNGSLANRLSAAIRGRCAFRRFKDTLASDATELERSYEFKDRLMMDRALEWLKEIGVEAIPPQA